MLTSDRLVADQLSESRFRLRNDVGKRRLVMNRQISQNTAVQVDVGFFQAGNQLAVSQAFSPGLRIDADNPQRTEVALFRPAVAVSVLTGFDNSLLGNPEYARTRTIVAFSGFQYFFVAPTRLNTSFYTSHDSILTKFCLTTAQHMGSTAFPKATRKNPQVREFPYSALASPQHAIDRRLISRADDPGSPQLTLTLGGHFGEDMAFEGPFDFVTGSGFLKTLGRAAMYFSFWHESNSAFESLRLQLIFKAIRQAKAWYALS
jgi:hypothetical protein